MLVDSWCKFLVSTPIVSSICFHGGFSVYILIISGIILCVKKRKKELVAIMPCYVYIILMMMSVPNNISRYVLPMIEYSTFFCLYSVFVPYKEQAVK